MKNKYLIVVESLLFSLVLVGIFILGIYVGDYNTADSIEYSSNYTYEPNITYENLTMEQIIGIKEIMNQVKEIYLIEQDEIIFTNSNESLTNGRNGVNYGNGRKIVIDYQTCYKSEDKNNTEKNCGYNERYFKQTICHELLHSYITEIEKELEEEIVEDLDDYLFCFK